MGERMMILVPSVRLAQSPKRAGRVWPTSTSIGLGCRCAELCIPIHSGSPAIHISNVNKSRQQVSITPGPKSQNE